MQKILTLGAMGFAGLADLAVGIGVVSSLAFIYGVDLKVWHCALGAFLAVAPDSDLIYYFSSKRKGLDHHQFLTHRPLFGVPVAAIFGYLLGGWFWALAAGLLIAWHYLHDTEGFLGGGIAWLWPFSPLYYGVATNPLRIVVKSKEEAAKKRSVRSDGVDERGIDKYLRPSYKCVMEMATASAALATAGFLWIGLAFGLALGVLVWVGIVGFWVLALFVEIAHKATF